MGGKKKQQQLICGNVVIEMEGKKIEAIDLWQWNCQNGRGKKKNYGNEVAKNWMRERERERENCLDKIK